MKMYILIPEDVPIGFAINGAAHAGLACFLRFASRRSLQEWLPSFKKVTCKVSYDELEQAIQSVEHDSYTVITESAFGNRTVAVAFCPRQEWPEIFKQLQLYR